MLRIWKTSAVVCLILVLPCLAGASMLAQMKGTIASVRAERNEFVMSESFKNITFKVADSAPITINGATGKLADLKAGDRAVVMYERQGQTMIAMAVSVMRKTTASGGAP